VSLDKDNNPRCWKKVDSENIIYFLEKRIRASVVFVISRTDTRLLMMP
jgi:hypothetical protein